MRILIDADACPVKKIILKLAKLNNIPVIMVADTSHELSGAEVITVDKGSDSADIKLANIAREGDIVVTQDFGVAAMAIAKKAKAINQNGLIYSDENIDSLLYERHISAKMRRAGKKTLNIKKRTIQDDDAFEQAFIKLLK